MEHSELINQIQSGFEDITPNKDIMFDNIINKIEQSKSEMKDIDNVIEFKSRKKKFNTGYLSVAAAAIALFICALIFAPGVISKNRANYTVVFDVNPSISIVLDHKYKVKSISGLNDDGLNVVKKINVKKGDDLNAAVDSMVNTMVSDGYLNADSAVLITFAKNKKANIETLENNLYDQVSMSLASNNLTDAVVCVQVCDLGKSTSGRSIIEDYLIKNTDIDENLIKAMSMKELLACANDNNYNDISYKIDNATTDTEATTSQIDTTSNSEVATTTADDTTSQVSEDDMINNPDDQLQKEKEEKEKKEKEEKEKKEKEEKEKKEKEEKEKKEKEEREKKEKEEKEEKEKKEKEEKEKKEKEEREKKEKEEREKKEKQEKKEKEKSNKKMIVK